MTPSMTTSGVWLLVEPAEFTGNDGAAGFAGALVSMTRFILWPAADLLPAGSTTVALTAQVPSVRVFRSQLDTDADFT